MAISFLDSQNIPKTLLDRVKNNIIVDNFIFNMKKYSLITNKSLPFSHESTLSIHRSTQKMILEYLINNLKNDKDLIQSVIIPIDHYMTDIIESYDHHKIKLLLVIVKRFGATGTYLTLDQAIS